MQDRQAETFFATHGFLDHGLISFNKPNEQVSLWQVLEPTADQRFFLSSTACAGILRRAEKRGKVLPPLLELSLRTVAGSTAQPETPTN